MGFFSGLLKKMGNSVGLALEKVGEVTHISKIESVGIELQVSCDFGKIRYDSGSSSAQETVDVDAEFLKYFSAIEIELSQKGYEENLIKCVLDEIIEVGNSILSVIDVERIHDILFNYSTEIYERFEGRYIEILKNHFSLYNNTCKAALNEVDANIRNDKMNKLAEKAKGKTFEILKGELMVYRYDCIQYLLSNLSDEIEKLKIHLGEKEKVIKSLMDNRADTESIEVDMANKLIEKETFILIRDYLNTLPINVSEVI